MVENDSEADAEMSTKALLKELQTLAATAGGTGLTSAILIGGVGEEYLTGSAARRKTMERSARWASDSRREEA